MSYEYSSFPFIFKFEGLSLCKDIGSRLDEKHWLYNKI